MQAPEGYHLNEETFTTQLIDGQAATVTIPDKIKPGLIIRKVDAETGEPLAGAVFTVTRPSGRRAAAANSHLRFRKSSAAAAQYRLMG